MRATDSGPTKRGAAGSPATRAGRPSKSGKVKGHPKDATGGLGRLSRSRGGNEGRTDPDMYDAHVGGSNYEAGCHPSNRLRSAKVGLSGAALHETSIDTDGSLAANGRLDLGCSADGDYAQLRAPAAPVTMRLGLLPWVASHNEVDTTPAPALPNDPPDVDRGVVLDGPFVEDAKQSAVVAGGDDRVNVAVSALRVPDALVNSEPDPLERQAKRNSLGLRGLGDVNALNYARVKHNSYTDVYAGTFPISSATGLERPSPVGDAKAQALRSADGHYAEFGWAGGDPILRASDPIAHVTARHRGAGVDSSPIDGVSTKCESSYEASGTVECLEGDGCRPVSRTLINNLRQKINRPAHHPLHRKTLKRALQATALIATVLLASASPATAARGHVPCPECSFTPSGANELKEPAGVAVNESTGEPASGDVYVADKGNRRVERFNSEGKFEGEITGPSGEGTGSVKAGETTVTGVFKGPGEFTVGEEITASELGVQGLEPGTTIEAVDLEAGTLTLSKPATETFVSAELKAHQSFVAPEGVAVDDSCFVHRTPPEEAACKAVDQSAGDVYVLDGGREVVDKFTATGEYLGQITGETVVGSGHEFQPQGVAVDPNGKLMIVAVQGGLSIDSFNDQAINVLEGSLRLSPSALTKGLPNVLAVDSTGDFYTERNIGNVAALAKYNAKAEEIGHLLEPRHLGPGEFALAAGIAAELPSDDVYVDTVGAVLRFGPEGKELESLSVPGMHGSGVAVDSNTGTVYVADSVSGTVHGFSLEPPSAPKVKAEGVSAVTSDSADLSGELQPDGILSEYRFEYGETTEYGSSLPAGVVGASGDFGEHQVSAGVLGLAAHTTYHFRVVVSNECEPVEHPGHRCVEDGRDESFTTQTTGGALALPDGRAWQLVSPANKQGAQIDGAGQASLDGTAVTYQASAPTETGPQGYDNTAQVFSSNVGGGWSTKDIAIPHEVPTGQPVGGGPEYRWFSEDLSAALIQPFGGFPAPGSLTSLSEDASEQTPYLRDDATGAFTPLVVGCPGSGPCRAPVSEHADVPAGTVFGLSEAGQSCPTRGTKFCGPVVVGGSPDLGAVVLQSRVALTGLALPVPKGPSEVVSGLYEWAGGRLAAVSVLPAAHEGEETLAPVARLGLAGRDAVGAVSGDGSRVVWQTGVEIPEHLYVRDVALGQTLQVDAVQGASGKTPDEQPGTPPEATPVPRFQFASADGSRVFFTDDQQLTEHSKAHINKQGEEVADLYECEIVPAPATGKLECNLSDLTPEGTGGGVLAGGVDGSERGCDAGSPAGCYVYFVANGALTSGAVQGGCKDNPAPGTSCDLYVLRDGAGGWEGPALVGVLSGLDYADWAEHLTGRTVRVSPDGRWLSFMSQAPLTGYDNADARSGQPDEEVFLYHAPQHLATGSGGAGSLTCASCNPTGARPQGTEYERIGPLAQGERVWRGNTGIAASISGWNDLSLTLGSRYQPRYLSDGGRLFFDSSDTLVPQDVNGQENVYQYEPAAGAGGGSESPPSDSCTTESSTYSPRSGGCVSLISSGESSGESAFLDASENGDDVFLLTSTPIAGEDIEGGVDVYDAHVCTPERPCASPAAEPPPCTTTDSCRAAPTPQPEVFGAPASATFSGPGNVAPALPVTSGSSAPPCSSSLGAPSKGCTKKQNLSKALATCKRRYPHSKKKRATCERTARKTYAPKVAKKSSRKASR